MLRLVTFSFLFGLLSCNIDNGESRNLVYENEDIWLLDLVYLSQEISKIPLGEDSLSIRIDSFAVKLRELEYNILNELGGFYIEGPKLIYPEKRGARVIIRRTNAQKELLFIMNGIEDIVHKSRKNEILIEKIRYRIGQLDGEDFKLRDIIIELNMLMILVNSLNHSE